MWRGLTMANKEIKGTLGLNSFLYFLIHARDKYIDQDKNSQDVSTQQFL